MATIDPLILVLSPGGRGDPNQAVAEIVRRYLRTHALIGLDELIARYPIDPALATEWLERLADEGGLVRLDPAEGGEARWAERANLEEVRRLSIALRRRESVAVAPEVFADFVARRQYVHPSTRREGKAALELALEQLQGFAATADLWESEILPRRVRDYRTAWLDEVLSGGGWTWRAEADGRGEPRVAIVTRNFAGAWPTREEPATPTEEEAAVLDQLRSRGACFADEIARGTGLPPSRARAALRGLLRLGLATNDRFDPLRPGSADPAEALSRASETVPRLGRLRMASFRRASTRPEGRWSRIEPPATDAETHLLAWAVALLDRYGVLTRETAALDPWAPPWRDLQPILGRAELRGDLRRGYFIEGLSGVQYATSEAADELARRAGSPSPDDPPVLLSTLDPANLYGSGAPLDVPLLEGGTARLLRSPPHFLVLIGGRPVLIIEAFGRRLTGLASASEAELRSALALLPTLAGPSRRVLKVETYNNAATLASPATPWLADLGFVRDPPGMAYYAGW